MNIIDYIKKYNYTFQEKKANELDYLIFSLISYLDLRDIVPSNKRDKMTIQELATKYFEKYPKINFKEQITAKRASSKLLKTIKDTKRYKDVLVYNYSYLGNEYTQFGALTIEIDECIFISFEGTDELISAWKEDCVLSYEYPVIAHKKAQEYTKQYLFSRKKLILGGHSKGGNIALVTTMLSNPFLRRKIKKIYSFDGPGLRLTEFESKSYKRVRDKLIHIIPNNSLIGILLRHENDIVVKANAITFVSHLPLTWEIEDTKLVRTTLSKSSIILNRGLTKWLDKYSYEQRKEFTTELFKVFEQNNVSTLNDFKVSATAIINCLKSLLKVDSIVKEMSSDLLSIIKDSIKE